MRQTYGFSLPQTKRFAGFVWGPQVHRAGGPIPLWRDGPRGGAS